jgi:hypothetical protein
MEAAGYKNMRDRIRIEESPFSDDWTGELFSKDDWK